ncbi:hypothetical protein PQQ88_05640 [Paraburkholderia caledonica]|uniref:hypothetical protein n=1 Tax=Paraburkholderia caledonica TaxID=134536 RepID=UPI00048393CC|nr:hypothetical protein [Paraburkholderia caledonica]AXF17561.1 hypothetical protein CUJ87_25220 [Paraburkholderia caledonica]
MRALHSKAIVTLADLTVSIPDLGAISAKRTEVFFTAHPALTERARALIATSNRGSIVPWESLRLPHEVDGSAGRYRAPSRDLHARR